MLQTFGDTWEGIENVPFDLLYLLIFLIVSVIALGFGMFAHLWEDSTTVSGIRWFPNKNRITRGQLRVGGTNEDMAFTVYAGSGVILVLLELYYVRNNLLLQLLSPIIAIGVFLSLGSVFRLSIVEKLYGKDKLIKEIQTRRKAEENSVEIEVDGIMYRIERDRIKRGIKLSQEYKNIQTMHKKTDYNIIDRGEGMMECSCKDFKLVRDLTLCKHLVASLIMKNPEAENRLKTALRIKL